MSNDLSIPEGFSDSLSNEDVAALMDMFAGAGWKVLMRLKAKDQKTSHDIVMNPSTPIDDPQVVSHRAVYNALDADLNFEAMIRRALAEKATILNSAE